jgi:hypothetical protein
MQRRIVDMQARFVEVGRIRLGEWQGNRPAKLDKLRFTSQNRKLLDEIATLYNGHVTQWDSPRGPEWQCYIDDEEIDIIVPPSDQAVTTSYEQWTAAGMQKYCDGNTMKLPGSDEEHACECKYADERVCKIKARMIVWLPKIQTLGVWRLETGSWYAAGELSGMVDMLLNASMMLRQAVTAKLRLDRRVVKREGMTYRFNVPIITPVGDVAHVLSAAAPMQQLPAARSVDERPALPEVVTPPETTEWPTDDAEDETERVDTDEAITESYDEDGVVESRNPGDVIEVGTHKALMISCRAVNLTDDERHDLVRHVTKGRVESSKLLRYEDMAQVYERLTNRATVEVQSRFRSIWPEPASGWAALHSREGLEGEVKTWGFKEWVIALEWCDQLIAEADTSSESQK